MGRHLSKLTSLLSTLLILGSVTAPVDAQDANQSSSSKPEQTIKIGFVGSLTSVGEDMGKHLLNGMNLYLDEVHHKMAGKNVEFFVENDESSPAKGAAKVRKLVQQNNV